MNRSFSPQGAENSFVSTTREFPLEPEDLRVTLEHTYTEVAQAINFREIGGYTTAEVLTGKNYFNPTDLQNPRLSYRRLYTFTGISAGSTKTIAHNVSGTFQLTGLEGFVTTASDQRPIPYASATSVTSQIEILVDSTNITIINGATAPAITGGFVVMEYIYT